MGTHYTGDERKEFDPQLDVPVNITELFEVRHANRAASAISHALDNYMPEYSSPFTGYSSEFHYWVYLGPMPISKKLKETLKKKFVVSYGELLFKNLAQMNSEYPEILARYKLHEGDLGSFVGLPLPEDDCKKDSEEELNEAVKENP